MLKEINIGVYEKKSVFFIISDFSSMIKLMNSFAGTLPCPHLQLKPLIYAFVVTVVFITSSAEILGLLNFGVVLQFFFKKNFLTA